MKVRVFYGIHHEIPPRSKETSPEVLEDVRKELTKLKSELELVKNEKDKIRIQRKITRLERFNDVQEGKITSDKKDEVQKILKGKTTENYLGSDLHLLRKRGVDIASLTLVKESNPAEAAKSSDMKSGDVFIVNFGGNDSLKKKIGAGDILPPEVTKVRINGVECERKNNPRPGFYNEKGKYQPIYDDYKIEVVERRISISPEEIKAADEAAENRWKKVRMNDAIESSGNILTALPEDASLEKEIEEEKKRREDILKFKPYSGKGIGLFTTEAGPDAKFLGSLTFDESVRVFEKVFGRGPATDLIITLDKEHGGHGTTLQRMMALGKHEGGLVFNRGFGTGGDRDPSSGVNLGTFQIGGRNSTYKSSLIKYNKCLQAGFDLADEYGIEVSDADLNIGGQRDLLAHLGFIVSEYPPLKHGGRALFTELANPNLSDNEIVDLMSNRIQGGVPAIGKNVVAYMQKYVQVPSTITTSNQNA